VYKIRIVGQRICLGVLLMLSFGTVVPSRAQQYLANLTGEVSDSTGAKVAGAEISATNTTTKFTTKSVTNGSGGYSIPFLTPGTYDITVECQGFRAETHSGIVLTAGSNLQTDFSLQVGTQADKVIVTTEAAPLNTGSATLETTLGAKEVTDLPNVGRNPFVLSTLAAGVTTGAYMQSKASGFTNPFSGTAVQILANGSSGHNRLTLDGIPDDPAERLSGAGYTGFVPSPEAVQEMNTQTALYDAQYGHGNGTVLNTVLRSGSNTYHGSAYFVFRNTYLDANTYERVPNQNGAVNAASPTHRVNDQWSQPGFVLDGPLSIPHLYNAHDKTFFMIAYERIQLHQPLPYSTLVPTAAQLGGNFSSLCTNFDSTGRCVAGAGQQLYDPTSAVDSKGNRTAFFPGNIIPASRISAVGSAYASYFPVPNSSLSRTINYISSDTSEPNKYFSFVTRADHSITENNKFNATFFKAVLNQLEPNEGFPKNIGPSGIGYTVYRNNMGGSLDYVSVLPHGYVVDARLGVIYHPFGLVYPGNTFDLSTININGTGLPYQSFPGSTFTDNYLAQGTTADGLAAGNSGQISEFTLGSASLLVSKIIRKHSLRIGFDGNLSRYNVQNPQSGLGVFNFTRQFTQQNSVSAATGADASSGDPIAALLLGYPSSPTGSTVSYSNQVAFALQQSYQAYFVQDDWRLSSKLTVNMGLRWDYESPFTDRYNRQNSGFCTTCANPLQSSVSGLTLLGGLQFVSSANRFPYPRDLNNFQPRFGVAYQLNPRVVLRGGIGIIYFNTLENPLGQGFSATTNYVGTTDNTHPATSFANPFPSGVNLPTGSSLGLATQIGQNLTFPDPNHVNPKMIQYSVSSQTQLPASMVLTIAYVGNKVSQLEISKNINALSAQYFNRGPSGVTFLQGTVTNPMAGLIPTNGNLNGASIQRQYILLPFPEFGTVTDAYASYGSALYNSLQTSVTKQVNHGLFVMGNFTWSKIMDQNIYLNAQDPLTSPFRYQDPNPNLVANLVATYQLPTLSGKPAYERLTIGGWEINSVLRAQNGNLVSTPGSSTTSGGNVTLLSSPRLGNATYAHYFNTCYQSVNATTGAVQNVVGTGACDSTTSIPAFQQHLNFTLNNVGPYLNDVRQRVHPLMDLSLFKQFRIKERTSLEIRGEFFNVLNTPNFGAPNTSLGNSAFGTVTRTQANDPRLTQLTARINF